MGRKKAYKPAALRRAVQEYFAALRYREPVYREEPVLDDDGQPEFDRYGHPATRFVRVVTEDGTPARRTSWVSPPTITGLCGRLGISRQTWSKYLAADETHDICDEAKRVIETYLQERLEDKNSAAGAKFALQANYDWRERREISTDAPTRAAIAGGEMTMDDKLALLREIQGMQLPGTEGTHDSDGTV